MREAASPASRHGGPLSCPKGSGQDPLLTSIARLRPGRNLDADVQRIAGTSHAEHTLITRSWAILGQDIQIRRRENGGHNGLMGYGLVRSRKGSYRAYLLRLWQVCDGGRLDWRASLEDAHSGERRGFARLADLVRFLESQAFHVGGDQHDRAREEGE